MGDARITAVEVSLDDLRDEIADLKVEVRRLRKLVIRDRGSVPEEADSRSFIPSVRGQLLLGCSFKPGLQRERISFSLWQWRRSEQCCSGGH